MDPNIAPSIFDELAAEQLHLVPATLGQRFTNFIIDSIVFYLVIVLSFGIIGFFLAITGMNGEEIVAFFSNTYMTYCIQTAELILLYVLVEGASKGRSPGKLVTRTVAVKAADGKPISWKDALIRSLCRIIPFEPVSAFSDTPWHDTMSKTMVVRKRTT